jgi:uncharacterized protein
LKLKSLAWLVAGAGTGMLVYGALIESKRLVVSRKTLRLKGWPKRLSDFRIALLADFHIRDQYSVQLALRAVQAAVDDKPDMIVFAGDLVGYWKEATAELLDEVLSPLWNSAIPAVGVPGNHEYWRGGPEYLEVIFDRYNIVLLRNRSILMGGIQWVGIDSLNAGRADPCMALRQVGPEPLVAIWHEPDAVDALPQGCDLMLSGHSHGGQFVLPGGFVPMTSRNGKRYLAGFYPDAPTPLFVTRGVGTTGPPSRFLCPPELVILTLRGIE